MSVRRAHRRVTRKGVIIVRRHVVKPRLGSGRRFKKLSGDLRRRGVRNPDALAAWIGRRKYGVQNFAKLGRLK